LIRLKDGTKFIDVYQDTTRVFYVLSGQRVRREAVKSMSLYREPSVTWLPPARCTIDMKLAREFRDLCPVAHNQGSYDKPGPTCGKPLDEKGCCEQHGKVRRLPHEKEEKPEPVVIPRRRRRYRKPSLQ